MRVTPRTEADTRAADKPNLLRDSWYLADISAFETESKRGSPMFEVSAAVQCPDGTQRILPDYLTDSLLAAKRLRHLAHAVGAGASYEVGEITADQLSGTVRVKIGTERKRGYRPRNVILDYEAAASLVVASPLRQVG